jgi:hypothetical protein
MSGLKAIKARAKAYAEHGTPGLYAPQDRAVLMAAVDAVLGLHREIQCRDDEGDDTGFTCCEECVDIDDHDGEVVNESFPCRTVREITKAFSGQESYAAMRDKIEAGVREGEAHVRGEAPKELF